MISKIYNLWLNLEHEKIHAEILFPFTDWSGFAERVSFGYSTLQLRQG